MNIDTLDLSIIKTILTNRKYALEFVHDCNERLFSSDLWRFAKIVIDYVKLYKEVATKRVILEKVKSQKNDALVKYVEELFTKIEAHQYDDKEYKHDLEKLKKRYSEKLIVGLKDNLVGQSEGIDLKKSVNDIQVALNNIKNVNKIGSYKQGTLKDYSEDFRNIYNLKIRDPNYGVGAKTGYTFMDHANSGLRPGELVIFAGITSSGKSLLLMNTAIQMWFGENDIAMTSNFRNGCNVLLFSLEMNYEDYMQRAISRIAMVPQVSIRDAKLTDEEKARVAVGFKFVKNYNRQFTVIDLPRKATPEAIENMIDDHTMQHGKPEVVVIDYLNLMSVDSDADDWLMQAQISEAVHELARAKELIILTAVQLNPKGGNKTSGFGIKDFRRATQIADNADMIAVINSRPNERSFPDFCVDIVKNRRGELTSGKLHKHMECCALLNTNYDKGMDPDDISGSLEKFNNE
jgi:replicative DNA helicase